MKHTRKNLLRLLSAAILATAPTQLTAEPNDAANVFFGEIINTCIPQVETQTDFVRTGLKEVPPLRRFQIFSFMSKTMDPEGVRLWKTASDQVVLVEDGESRSCYILGFKIEEQALLDAYRAWRENRNDDEFLVFSDIETQTDMQKRLGRHGLLAKKLNEEFHVEVIISSHYKYDNFVTAFVAFMPQTPVSDKLFGAPSDEAQSDE